MFVSLNLLSAAHHYVMLPMLFMLVVTSLKENVSLGGVLVRCLPCTRTAFQRAGAQSTGAYI